MEIIAKAPLNESSAQTVPPAIPTEALIRRLWQRMTEIYGHRWISAYGADANAGSGDTWAKGLIGLSAVQIGKGLERALLSAEPWPPTLPEFRALCFDIPAFSDVLQELKPGAVAVSPFVRHLWTLIDPYALRLADARNERQILHEAYEMVCRYVMAGGALPGESQRIEHDPEAERLMYDKNHFQTYGI